MSVKFDENTKVEKLSMDKKLFSHVREAWLSTKSSRRGTTDTKLKKQWAKCDLVQFTPTQERYFNKVVMVICYNKGKTAKSTIVHIKFIHFTINPSTFKGHKNKAQETREHIAQYLWNFVKIYLEQIKKVESSKLETNTWHVRVELVPLIKHRKYWSLGKYDDKSNSRNNYMSLCSQILKLHTQKVQLVTSGDLTEYVIKQLKTGSEEPPITRKFRLPNTNNVPFLNVVLGEKTAAKEDRKKSKYNQHQNFQNRKRTLKYQYPVNTFADETCTQQPEQKCEVNQHVKKRNKTKVFCRKVGTLDDLKTRNTSKYVNTTNCVRQTRPKTSTKKNRKTKKNKNNSNKNKENANRLRNSMHTNLIQEQERGKSNGYVLLPLQRVKIMITTIVPKLPQLSYDMGQTNEWLTSEILYYVRFRMYHFIKKIIQGAYDVCVSQHRCRLQHYDLLLYLKFSNQLSSCEEHLQKADRFVMSQYDNSNNITIQDIALNTVNDIVADHTTKRLCRRCGVYSATEQARSMVRLIMFVWCLQLFSMVLNTDTDSPMYVLIQQHTSNTPQYKKPYKHICPLCLKKFLTMDRLRNHNCTQQISLSKKPTKVELLLQQIGDMIDLATDNNQVSLQDKFTSYLKQQSNPVTEQGLEKLINTFKIPQTQKDTKQFHNQRTFILKHVPQLEQIYSQGALGPLQLNRLQQFLSTMPKWIFRSHNYISSKQIEDMNNYYDYTVQLLDHLDEN